MSPRQGQFIQRVLPDAVGMAFRCFQISFHIPVTTQSTFANCDLEVNDDIAHPRLLSVAAFHHLTFDKLSFMMLPFTSGLFNLGYCINNWTILDRGRGQPT